MRTPHAFKRETELPHFDEDLRKRVLRCMHHDSYLHGEQHWRRVLHNAYFLAEAELGDLSEEDEAVIHLFSLFHDSQRFGDGDDEGHGGRGTSLLVGALNIPFHMRLRFRDPYGNRRNFQVEMSSVVRAVHACVYHTEALPSFLDAKLDVPFAGDTTQQICFDADRLDLPRVGTRPSPRYLFTDTARRMADEKTLLHW
jgi:uncharacterized protein